MPSTSTFNLPDFIGSCPFPLRANPHLDPVAAESNEWIDGFGVHPNDAHRKAYEACNFGLLVSHTYPKANAERYRVLCDFINSLFSFDDLMDEEDLVKNIDATRRASDIAMNALWHPDTYKTDFRIGQSIADFWGRAIKLGASAGTQRRFLEYTDMYCNAVHEQVTNRAKNHIMDIESFTKMRRDTGALKMCYVMGEFGLGLDLPDEVMEHPLIKVMENCSNDVVVLSNDVFSWNIEQAQGHTANIVTVLMNQHKIPVQTAMNMVETEVHKRFRVYQDAKDNLPSWGKAVDEQVLLYATVLEDWMIGNFEWSLTGLRYFGKKTAQVKKTLIVEISPKENKTATELRNEDAPAPSPSSTPTPAPLPSPKVSVHLSKTMSQKDNTALARSIVLGILGVVAFTIVASSATHIPLRLPFVLV